MIDIKKSVDCCGCNACGDVCPKDAINYKVDIEGFWYPKVDLQKCIDCGLCDGVCPIINVDVLKKNDYLKPECFAAINNNLEVRFDSTSGGLFSVFADKTYRAKGFVGGALFNSSFLVEHSISDDKNDLEALRSSKYLQSDLKGFYRSVDRKSVV